MPPHKLCAGRAASRRVFALSLLPLSIVFGASNHGSSQLQDDHCGDAEGGTELQEVVFVVQSQRNSFHAQRAEEKRAKLLRQATELKAVTEVPPTVHKVCTRPAGSAILREPHMAYVTSGSTPPSRP